MKKLLIVCIAALALAGVAAAQVAPAAPAAQQITKLSGKLELINGVIGLKADGISYYIPRLRELVGFVKDLQEGSSVKLEGYVYPIPSQAGFSMLHVTKLTFSGKDYDLSQNVGNGSFGGRGMRGGRGGGMGGNFQGGQRGGMMNGPRW